MVFGHISFKLNTDTRKVYNRHGEETRITGNAYRLLELLCQRYPESVTMEDVAISFDLAGAKNYNEDYVRVLRGQITSILNADVIEYKNKVYALIGEVVKKDSIEDKKQIPATAEAVTPSKTAGLYWLLGSFALVVLVALLYFLYPKTKSLFQEKNPDDMVMIPAGEFIMGSTEQEIQQVFNDCKKDEGNYCVIEDYEAEYPRQTIVTADFLIDRKEISNTEYNNFLKQTGHKQQSDRYRNDTNLNGPNQPVVGVSWDDAVTYCSWSDKRLPTEEEWMKAGRGTNGHIWPWGNDWNPSNLNHGIGGDPGLDDSDGYLYSAPVGFDADISSYGVLNMGGNVSEWVADDFRPYAGNDKYHHSEYSFDNKVFLGGSYYASRADTRLAGRGYSPKDSPDIAIGFRCAKGK
ncbi:MAG: SUMF1/EgtB/PvdO family nonheme iron enzyme [Candidatus Yanofskybacteria bacterium]|nr:SUMF1/EgtB/PvdO family nonheme iron enzyme [Candidatus Yanofskybacteria bacterium]